MVNDNETVVTTTKDNYRDSRLKALTESKYEFEREMGRICTENPEMPLYAEDFVKKLLEGIYATVEAQSKMAESTIRAVEDEYNQFLFDSDQIPKADKERIVAAQEKRERKAKKLKELTGEE